MTTIEVPKELRDAVMKSARAEGLTAAEFIRRATAEHVRQQRFAAVRRAHASTPADREYREVTEDWDAAIADGLT